MSVESPSATIERPQTQPSRWSLTNRVPTNRANVLGWIGVAGITAVVAATWATTLAAAYGDNHEGRVFSRFALQVRNLAEHGLVGSQFATDMAPYGRSYAHHPPLATILDALFSALPGEGEYQMRLAPYLLGLLAIPAAAALLRAFGLRWPPVLVALGMMVVTGFFWVYARIVFDLGLLMAMAAAIAHVRRQAQPSRRLLVVACVTSFLATLGSWPGIALAALLGLWLLSGRRRVDRVTVAVAVSMVAGLLGSLAFMLGVAGVSNLSAQTRFRTEGGDFTVREFVVQQWLWFRQLLPSWYLALLPVGVVVGLLRRRTRAFTALATALAVGWVVLLPNGSFIHDYWPYIVLIPGVVGMAALLDAVWARVPARLGTLRGCIAGLVALGLVVAFAAMVRGPMARDYIVRPLGGGTLVADHGPAPGQVRAWHISFGAVRWLAYYWDLAPAKVLPENASMARSDDLALMHLDRIPEWLPASVADQPVAREGRYVLVRMADVQAALRHRSPGE
ncbi:hypothetical protein ABN034_08940 [Actinopolymorpha sp. B11F2]|uniref:hypothetical protein n=1 Tax=Actinopolymorpha sp. B11F2 TaxID=3160862 RepID=UPI0032E4CB22